jgi:hypothetical protein
MRIAPFILVGLLGLAAAGRLHAEAQVRESERELARLADARAEVTQSIERTRLDVEVLESAGRLHELNGSHLRLRAVRAEQLLSDRDFAEVIGLSPLADDALIDPDADIIGNAIGMSDPSLAERVVAE